MSQRYAPGVGVVLAGVALAASLQPWPDAGTLLSAVPIAGGAASLTPIAGVLSAVALAAFLASRHGALDRARGNVAAGVPSVGVALYAAVVAVGALDAGDAVGLWVLLAMAAGAGAGLAALVDGLELPVSGVLDRLQLTVSGAILGVLGLLALSLWNTLLVSLFTAVAGSPGPTARILISTSATGLGGVTIVLGYLNSTDRGLDFIDAGWLDTRDVVYGVGGFVVLLLVLLVSSELIELFGLSSAEHSIVQTARANDPRVLLWLLVPSVLLVGPGEELLYRNVIQKSLYDSFSRTGAVLVTSVLFALVHFPAYATSGVLDAIGSLLLILPLSIVLGVVFARTENVVVPALIHGAFNAFQYAALYVALTSGIELV
ncbi:hypothetical protein SAMN06269185_2907 [Natronoarchaeum philippinense]|uniref:CAAX prenyl protease 2/Lysostaphin resistance protein A-like domain-containing protein n=1 Tax=Natronoarchaeum philippinense TaxID=558529 RepID=A0A285P5X6_NATPI|nr:CPBP family intramembrane glutamic endopeptidase [Natronoarchaeum philippinense]SNZ17169.1 hypothetical protein SAMN06269185_2907 [Natronoarchaeum philippinense]